MRANRQRGAISVLAAMWLVVAIAALGAIDVGNVFFKQRSLQSAADMSASAAAQVVDNTWFARADDRDGRCVRQQLQSVRDRQFGDNRLRRWDSTLYTGPTYFASG